MTEYKFRIVRLMYNSHHYNYVATFLNDKTRDEVEIEIDITKLKQDERGVVCMGCEYTAEEVQNAIYRYEENKNNFKG